MSFIFKLETIFIEILNRYFNKIQNLFFDNYAYINTRINKPDPKNLISDFKLSENLDIRKGDIRSSDSDTEIDFVKVDIVQGEEAKIRKF